MTRSESSARASRSGELRQSPTAVQATVSFLPHHEGDGYGWGGDMIVTIGAQSINLGRNEKLGYLIANAVNATADLRASLAEILDYRGGADTALHDDYVVERAQAALAKSVQP